MIVVDASAITAVLVEPVESTRRLRSRLEHDGEWAVPEHFMTEALNALRGVLLLGRRDPELYRRAAARLTAREFDVWPTRALAPRIVELAPNATAYDAAYIALAEETGSILLTADRKLAAIPGIRCRVDGPHDSSAGPTPGASSN